MALRETFIPEDRNGRCPGCGCSSPHPLRGAGKPFEFRTRLLVFWQNEYHIFRCGLCGLVFKDSILPEGLLDMLYEDVDFSGWAACQVYPTEKPVLKHINSLPKGSKVLDYGCSSGRLLAQANPKIERWGFEVNKAAAREASTKGIRMVTELNGLSSLGQTFDAVLLMDVFEHLSKPTELLNGMVDLVKPGGMLIVSTGNADCRACQIDAPNFLYFRSIQHLCMITKQYAEKFASQAGLQIALWHECSHYDISLSNRMAQHLRQWIYAFRYRHPGSAFVAAMDWMPVLRKSATWEIPPPFNASRDHAVVFFERQMRSIPR